MELHDIALLAANYVNTTDKHIFLTGKAGTGKTTFLKYIIQHTFKNTVVAAPTGIAAINAGGVTLHSLLQLPFGTFIPENIPLSDSHTRVNTPQTLFRDRKMNATKRKLLQELELLIIDEVSMLRADLLDCIDHVLRNIRKKNTPFGGLQILFIGDLHQLPPVVKEEEKRLLNSCYENLFFFQAKALLQSQPIQIELQKIYRQSDRNFIELLNRFRYNEQTNKDIDFLNQYYKPEFQAEKNSGYILLTTHNYKADHINHTELHKLEGKLFPFEAVIKGDFPENIYPTVSKLELKKGAQVMFIKNDPSGQGEYFNGKIGIVTQLDADNITVQCDDGNEINVGTYTWENKRFTLNKSTNEIEEKYLGSFEQFPLKLARAVTIHKSQGLTFEKAILDPENTFASGQLYVALSRLTSLKGLVLSSPIPTNPPGTDKVLAEFAKSSKNEDDLKSELVGFRKNFIQKFLTEAFTLHALEKALQYHLRGFNKAENRSVKQHYQEWTTNFHSSVLSLAGVGDKFIRQVNGIMQSDEYLQALHERVDKADDYFSPKLAQLRMELKQHKSVIKDKKKVKGYIRELESIESQLLLQIKQINKVRLFLEQAAENKVLTKTQLLKSDLYTKLNQDAQKPKNDKIPTALISFKLFQQGKNIEEIALERELTEGTIMGHLCKYIETGEIDAEKIIASDKLAEIIKAYEAGYKRSGEIKAVMSNDFTYGEIKVALSHIRRTGTKE
jgi:hypothetical protein